MTANPETAADPRVCENCGEVIHIMIFRNSGYCSDRCGKKLGKVK